MSDKQDKLKDEYFDEIFEKWDEIPEMTKTEQYDFDRGADMFEAGEPYRKSWSDAMKAGYNDAMEQKQFNRLIYLEGFFSFFTNVDVPDLSVISLSTRGYVKAEELFSRKMLEGDNYQDKDEGWDFLKIRRIDNDER